jgi:hypothetical protein
LQTLVYGSAEQGLYRPHVDRAVVACMEALPWWGAGVANATRKTTHQMARPFTATEWIHEGEEQVWEGVG